ncbi:hypothetical protein COW36_01025 [bacterium (Candidatus Blackallbacteria) CG17_big_fil_post_rev_8_21_14_2_50_48_46]|uniref:Uncharacterized protein n=1 Tax=bacterium (Candidatus Blackallbacteria) CG17_big_fil_post_rev_8_21_14_2_50_48_46 TaxID=2014261 RepID=A0A2M7GBD8_9BACT|nr:MAG: hypothetical protein COW64_10150 [bacterium (Candidatus Blackallbacteria) CG18_big_fil_WC_8_21_14_2_50_49_26]PIW19450.1 MAG: hypothetical protein COW36_01025 [bacterium (Candidatus Blackallbacteria) CG17_big_fil_post_rev_8_21_14_2_50_48_46]PIW48946.1 MAG: hypothetical protein COW20_07430 [bacterium (Candidatus Blackallbacteria) CG13_big_fil_rev_8_21_14_2_50_49_14]
MSSSDENSDLSAGFHPEAEPPTYRKEPAINSSKFRFGLHILRPLGRRLDQESGFILQLLVIFMCSASLAPSLRQVMGLSSIRISQQTVQRKPVARALSEQTVPRPSAKNGVPGTVKPPAKPARSLLTQALKPKVQAPVRVANLRGSFSGAGIQQAVRVSVRQTRPVRTQRVLSSAPKSPSPVAGIRRILREDYQISRVSGSYESYMRWVRQTLKTYQKAS